MLLMAGILFVGICVLVILYAVLGNHCGRKLAVVRERVTGDGEAILKADRDNDLQLAKDLGDGKPAQAAINRWQKTRSETLSVGKTSRPWAWTGDDLKRWIQDQIQTRGDAIKQSAMMQAIVTTTVVCLVFGGLTLAVYHTYSSRGSAATQPPATSSMTNGLSPVTDDPFANLPTLDDQGTTVPSADPTQAPALSTTGPDN